MKQWVRGSSGSAVGVDWGLLQLGPMFRRAFLWSLVSGLHLSQWLRSSSHNTVIHCTEQDLHRRFLTVWLKERFLREPCSSERVLITWNVTHADILGRNYVPSGLCIWICCLSSQMLNARKDSATASLWPRYRHISIVVHNLRIHVWDRRMTRIQGQPGWLGETLAFFWFGLVCFLRQINESFKQVE